MKKPKEEYAIIYYIIEITTKPKKTDEMRFLIFNNLGPNTAIAACRTLAIAEKVRD